jgi:site-specific recombinase XerD
MWSTPLGLRDRTMLELMYASGLRVSELVTLKTLHVSMNEGVLRVHGQGQQGAPGAVWPGGGRLDYALPG